MAITTAKNAATKTAPKKTAPKKQTVEIQQYVPEENPNTHYLNHQKTLWSWLATVDHKRIGIMYMATLVIMFAFAGTLALLLRTELLTPARTFIDANTYNQIFTLHGAIMLFFFLVPSVPAVLGNFILPIQLGAKDVAFPRLNLASYYIYLIGAVFALT